MAADIEEGTQTEVLENRVFRRIFGPKRDKVKGSGGNYIMRNLMICTAHPTLSG